MIFRQSALSLLAISLVGLILTAAPVAAQRPKAVDLLPEKTVLYVQIDDIKKFVEDFKQTGFGRMLQDERIAPLVTELWGEAQAAYQDVEEQVGVSFDDLQSLPKGEISFAIVTPRRSDPAFVFMMDVNQDTGAAEKLIDRGRQLAEDDGATMDSRTELGIEVHSVSGNDDSEQVHYVLHEGTFIAATNPEVFTNILTRWMGEPAEEDESLADNRKFVTIMNKCRSTEDLPMTLAFYADPIGLVRGFSRGTGATMVLGALPILGLDGLLGVGGASLFNEKGYESIFHMHVLLANPRAGIFEMIALKPGHYEPEPWIPADTVTYMTSSWDARKLMVELEKMVNMFGGEDFLQKQIETNINEELGIDFQTDVIENFEGRISYAAWITEPPRFNSQTNCVGVRVNDVEKGTALIEQFLATVDEEGENIVQETFEGITYWKSAEEIGGNRAQQLQRERRLAAGEDVDDSVNIDLRPTEPCFGFVGDYFILTETKDFFEHVVRTHKGDEPSLADDELYRETTEEMVRLLDTAMPSVTMYQRPDLALRMWFDLIKAQNTSDLLARGAEDNKYLKGLKRVIDENPLPEFDEIKHYFAPSGAFIVNDESGFHMLAFQVKIEED